MTTSSLRILPTRLAQQPARRFDGYPYIATRVAPGMLHAIVIPAGGGRRRPGSIAGWQARRNKLPTWLVLGPESAITFDPEGGLQSSTEPPAARIWVAGGLLPRAGWEPSPELWARQEALARFLAETPKEGFVLGDLGKGGWPASARERRALAGRRADGAPRGLEPCRRCGLWRGVCLDPPRRDWLVRVHCRCENDTLCARCGKPLHRWRVAANFYDPRDGAVWHVPGFAAFGHARQCADGSSVRLGP